MQFKAYQKYIRTSPRKLRLVADSIRKMQPKEALVTLKFMHKRAALAMFKVLKQAIANAKVQGTSEDNLKFVSLQVEEGPTLKRWRPVSRGRAHQIMKRMSHIKIVLADASASNKSLSSKAKKSEIRNPKS